MVLPGEGPYQLRQAPAAGNPAGAAAADAGDGRNFGAERAFAATGS